MTLSLCLRSTTACRQIAGMAKLWDTGGDHGFKPVKSGRTLNGVMVGVRPNKASFMVLVTRFADLLGD